MKFLKSSFLFLALGVTGAAFAQAPAPTPSQTPSTPPAMAAPHHPANPAREARRLSKELGLTADQAAQVAPIFADREQRIQALESNTTLDPKSIHKQRRAIMLDSEQKLNAVLTPAQQQQFATLRAQRKQRGTPPAPDPTASL